MILNGKNQTIGVPTSGLPDVSAAVMEILQPVSIGLIVKTLVNGRVQEVQNVFKTRATKQPFTDRQLILKPEGQRAWGWFTMHALVDVDLKVDDRFYFNGERYRVMQKGDFAEYGYFKYDIIEDFQGSTV